MTAERPPLEKLMKALCPGYVIIIPAVDRDSRDTTDLMVIARDMQREVGPAFADWSAGSFRLMMSCHLPTSIRIASCYLSDTSAALS